MFNFLNKKRLGPVNTERIDQTKDYYEKKYEHPYPIENYIPIFNKSIDFLKELDIEKSCNILDIGCGIGELGALIKNAGFNNYLGFDISGTGLEKAKERVPHWKDKFIKFDAYKIDELNYNYDITMAIEVLEHIQDFKLINNLKTGTKLIASVPNYWSSNNEHLRVYPSKFYIWKRYRKKMKFIKWYKYKLNKHRFMYIFSAEIK